MNTAIVTAAGVARPLRSGGYAIDCGDAFPTFTPDRESAKSALSARTPTDPRHDSGDAGTWPPGWTPASGNP